MKNVKMKNISIRELNNLMCSSNLLAGGTVTYGKNVYRVDRLDNGRAWVCHMPYEKYVSNSKEYDNTSVGWYALLRIA